MKKARRKLWAFSLDNISGRMIYLPLKTGLRFSTNAFMPSF